MALWKTEKGIQLAMPKYSTHTHCEKINAAVLAGVLVTCLNQRGRLRWEGLGFRAPAWAVRPGPPATCLRVNSSQHWWDRERGSLHLVRDLVSRNEVERAAEKAGKSICLISLASQAPPLQHTSGSRELTATAAFWPGWHGHPGTHSHAYTHHTHTEWW